MDRLEASSLSGLLIQPADKATSQLISSMEVPSVLASLKLESHISSGPNLILRSLPLLEASKQRRSLAHLQWFLGWCYSEAWLLPVRQQQQQQYKANKWQTTKKRTRTNQHGWTRVGQTMFCQESGHSSKEKSNQKLPFPLLVIIL